MGDSWQYRVLWEYAGLDAPNFHEEDLQSFGDFLGEIWHVVCNAEHAVSAALKELEPEVSSEAFDTINNQWVQVARPAITQLWLGIADVQILIGECVTAIYEWKANVILGVGAWDIVNSFNPANIGAHLVALAKGEAAHQAGVIAEKLREKVDELEGELIAKAINHTTLKDYRDELIKRIHAVDAALIQSAGHAAGQAVKG